MGVVVWGVVVGSVVIGCVFVGGVAEVSMGAYTENLRSISLFSAKL